MCVRACICMRLHVCVCEHECACECIYTVCLCEKVCVFMCMCVHKLIICVYVGPTLWSMCPVQTVLCAHQQIQFRVTPLAPTPAEVTCMVWGVRSAA